MEIMYSNSKLFFFIFFVFLVHYSATLEDIESVQTTSNPIQPNINVSDDPPAIPIDTVGNSENGLNQPALPSRSVSNVEAPAVNELNNQQTLPLSNVENVEVPAVNELNNQPALPLSNVTNGEFLQKKGTNDQSAISPGSVREQPRVINEKEAQMLRYQNLLQELGKNISDPGNSDRVSLLATFVLVANDFDRFLRPNGVDETEDFVAQKIYNTLVRNGEVLDDGALEQKIASIRQQISELASKYSNNQASYNWYQSLRATLENDLEKMLNRQRSNILTSNKRVLVRPNDLNSVEEQLSELNRKISSLLSKMEKAVADLTYLSKTNPKTYSNLEVIEQKKKEILRELDEQRQTIKNYMSKVKFELNALSFTVPYEQRDFIETEKVRLAAAEKAFEDWFEATRQRVEEINDTFKSPVQDTSNIIVTNTPDALLARVDRSNINSIRDAMLQINREITLSQRRIRDQIANSNDPLERDRLDAQGRREYDAWSDAWHELSLLGEQLNRAG